MGNNKSLTYRQTVIASLGHTLVHIGIAIASLAALLIIQQLGLLAKRHVYVSPATVFYARFVILAAVTATLAVRWNRWTIRRMLRKEFVRQLWLEHYGTVPETNRWPMQKPTPKSVLAELKKEITESETWLG